MPNDRSTNPDKLGALWVNESRTGDKYLSGMLEDGTRIVVFKNGFKSENEKAPDYIIYRSKDRDVETTPAKPRAHVASGRPRKERPTPDFDDGTIK